MLEKLLKYRYKTKKPIKNKNINLKNIPLKGKQKKKTKRQRNRCNEYKATNKMVDLNSTIATSPPNPDLEHCYSKCGPWNLGGPSITRQTKASI